MRSTSRRRSSSKASTSCACMRSTGSPNCRTSRGQCGAEPPARVELIGPRSGLTSVDIAASVCRVLPPASRGRTVRIHRRGHMQFDVWTTSRETVGDIDLTGFKVEARDGDIGKIDEATYDVGRSYLVVDTGPWIFGRKVDAPRRHRRRGSTRRRDRLREPDEGRDQERAGARRLPGRPRGGRIAASWARLLRRAGGDVGEASGSSSGFRSGGRSARRPAAIRTPCGSTCPRPACLGLARSHRRRRPPGAWPAGVGTAIASGAALRLRHELGPVAAAQP